MLGTQQVGGHGLAACVGSQVGGGLGGRLAADDAGGRPQPAHAQAAPVQRRLNSGSPRLNAPAEKRPTRSCCAPHHHLGPTAARAGERAGDHPRRPRLRPDPPGLLRRLRPPPAGDRPGRRRGRRRHGRRLARESGLELAVRSGGHSPAGHSTTNGGIVLDLGALRALEIDAEARTAWAEPGLTAGEYTTAAAAHGLGPGSATPARSASAGSPWPAASATWSASTA
jgi:hypothetical protein